MAIAFVRQFSSIAAGDTLTVPAGGVAAGNLLVVGGYWDDTSSTVSAVNDTAGNTYSHAVASVGVGHTADLWYSVLTNALVSGNSVTISLAGNDGIWIAQEFSGIASSPLDQAPAGTTDTTATNHTSGTTGTTAQADEVLIGLHGNAGNQAYTATGGYTQQPAGGIAAFGSFQLAMQYLIVAATGTYASTCTTVAGANSNNLIATFKAAAAGSVTGLAWISA